MSGGASGPLSRLHPVDRQPTRAPTAAQAKRRRVNSTNICCPLALQPSDQSYGASSAGKREKSERGRPTGMRRGWSRVTQKWQPDSSAAAASKKQTIKEREKKAKGEDGPLTRLAKRKRARSSGLDELPRSRDVTPRVAGPTWNFTDNHILLKVLSTDTREVVEEGVCSWEK
ncbi:hypothetical protein HL42_7106 [Trichophyton rubrum]|nr:hypothetical protein HL42_7106 [Trichophyton rubrum]